MADLLLNNANCRRAPQGRSRRASAVRQKVLFDVVAVGLEQHVGAAQLADLLVGALDHAVALARLRIEDLAGPRHLEALLGARFGLHLGHLALLCGEAAAAPSRISGTGRGRRDARYERIVREHVAAATAALFSRATGGRVMAEAALEGNRKPLSARRQHHDHLAAFEA